MGLMLGHDGEKGRHFLGEKRLGAMIWVIKGLVIPGLCQNLIPLTLHPSKLTWYFVCIFCLAVTTFCIKKTHHLIYSCVSILLCSCSLRVELTLESPQSHCSSYGICLSCKRCSRNTRECNEWMEGPVSVPSFLRILLISDYCAQWKKPVMKDHILYDPIFMKCPV